MIALGYFLKAVAEVLYWGLEIYMWLIIARALISWVNPDPYNPIVRFLYNVTEPVLSYLRRRFPMVYGGLDLSPLAVLERGYSEARTPEGKVLRRVEELPAGRTFLLRVVDGTVACESAGGAGPLEGEAT